ncbi:MAG: class GN sortase [Rhodospirillaceae bacterium]|nr:class GN sortase [Rhodospirillaceae bacterium]MCA8933635.1 class GN sortase [Rhodospirillaceae bacterium]
MTGRLARLVPAILRSPRGAAGLLIGAVGLWLVSDAALIHVKAWVGQVLLDRAWSRTLAGEEDVTPWPWADTWPVARLRSDAHGVDLTVLSGATGATLAWGPGWVQGTAEPGWPGLSVIGGHRDTHFRFLEDVVPGERFTLTRVDGIERAYRVTATRVVDQPSALLSSEPGLSSLTLVTCWPFDAVVPGGPQRYLVHLVEDADPVASLPAPVLPAPALPVLAQPVLAPPVLAEPSLAPPAAGTPGDHPEEDTVASVGGVSG